jgi:predicted MFS family arabinose efflux permease
MTHPVVPSRRTVWIGRVLSAIPIALMVFSASMKFIASPEALQFAVTHLGWPEAYLPRLALLEITCVVVYAIPQTAVLGAILLSGYLGGAVATHFRVGDVPVVQCLLIALAWGGLYLRDPRLRDLLPRVTPRGRL